MYTVETRTFDVFAEAIEYAKTLPGIVEIFLTNGRPDRGSVWISPKKVSNKKMQQYLDRKSAYDAQCRNKK